MIFVNLQRPNLIPLIMSGNFEAIDLVGQIDVAHVRIDQRHKPRVAQCAKSTDEIG